MVLQYNLLSVVKRFNDYETLGELFSVSQKDVLKLGMSEQMGQGFLLAGDLSCGAARD